jgi:hypothetical protein
MKKPTPRTLRLSAETVRHLENKQLKHVQGGAESNVAGQGHPYSCNGSCTCTE